MNINITITQEWFIVEQKGLKFSPPLPNPFMGTNLSGGPVEVLELFIFLAIIANVARDASAKNGG